MVELISMRAASFDLSISSAVVRSCDCATVRLWTRLVNMKNGIAQSSEPRAVSFEQRASHKQGGTLWTHSGLL